MGRWHLVRLRRQAGREAGALAAHQVRATNSRAKAGDADILEEKPLSVGDRPYI